VCRDLVANPPSPAPEEGSDLMRPPRSLIHANDGLFHVFVCMGCQPSWTRDRALKIARRARNGRVASQCRMTSLLVAGDLWKSVPASGWTGATKYFAREAQQTWIAGDTVDCGLSQYVSDPCVRSWHRRRGESTPSRPPPRIASRTKTGWLVSCEANSRVGFSILVATCSTAATHSGPSRMTKRLPVASSNSRSLMVTVPRRLLTLIRRNSNSSSRRTRGLIGWSE